MARKERTPLSKLSVALSGIDTCLTILDETDDAEKRKQLITKAKGYVEEATEAMITIQITLERL